MDEYPDVWVILKITQKDEPVIYKVLAGWYGGYLDGDSWKINSGITKIEQDEHGYLFYGASGSCYHCNRNSERTSAYTASIYESYKKKLDGIGVSMEIVSVDEVVAALTN